MASACPPSAQESYLNPTSILASVTVCQRAKALEFHVSFNCRGSVGSRTTHTARTLGSPRFSEHLKRQRIWLQLAMLVRPQADAQNNQPSEHLLAGCHVRGHRPT